MDVVITLKGVVEKLTEHPVGFTQSVSAVGQVSDLPIARPNAYET